MSKNHSTRRKEAEKVALAFFDLRNPIKTKKEVCEQISSMKDKQQKEKDKERLVIVSCLVFNAAMLVFSSLYLSDIIHIAESALTMPPYSTASIAFAAICFFGFSFSFFYTFYLLAASFADKLNMQLSGTFYFEPVDINDPRIVAGISNMLKDDEIAILNQKILALGRSVTLAEHILMWNIYKDSENFLNKKNAIHNLGLAKRK